MKDVLKIKGTVASGAGKYKNFGQPRNRNGDRAKFTTPHREVIHLWAEAQSGNKRLRNRNTNAYSAISATIRMHKTMRIRAENVNSANSETIRMPQNHCGSALKTQIPSSLQPSECQHKIADPR